MFVWSAFTCTCSSMIQSDTSILLGPASQLCQCVISKSTEMKVRETNKNKEFYTPAYEHTVGPVLIARI